MNNEKKKLTELTEIEQVANEDIFAIVDVSENETKKVKYSDLKILPYEVVEEWEETAWKLEKINPRLVGGGYSNTKQRQRKENNGLSVLLNTFKDWRYKVRGDLVE